MVLLDGGKVAAHGTHDELLATSARYRDVLAAWAARDEDVEDPDAPHVPSMDELAAEVDAERELLREVDGADGGEGRDVVDVASDSTVR